MGVSQLLEHAIALVLLADYTNFLQGLGNSRNEVRINCRFGLVVFGPSLGCCCLTVLRIFSGLYLPALNAHK